MYCDARGPTSKSADLTSYVRVFPLLTPVNEMARLVMKNPV